MTVKPRIKQVFMEVTENHRPISPVMREMGYAESTATKPANLTNTKQWQSLMDKYISDEKLAKVHNEGLEATKYESRLTGKGESEIVEVPDYAVRHRYLDTGYKIKGKMKDGSEGSKTLVLMISGETAERYGLIQTTRSTENDR